MNKDQHQTYKKEASLRCQWPPGWPSSPPGGPNSQLYLLWRPGAEPCDPTGRAPWEEARRWKAERGIEGKKQRIKEENIMRNSTRDAIMMMMTIVTMMTMEAPTTTS